MKDVNLKILEGYNLIFYYRNFRTYTKYNSITKVNTVVTIVNPTNPMSTIHPVIFLPTDYSKVNPRLHIISSVNSILVNVSLKHKTFYKHTHVNTIVTLVLF